MAGHSLSFPAACSSSCNASPTDIDISQASPPSPAQDVLQELDTGSTRSECPNCHGFFQVTSSGLLRAHGPAHNRCPGSSTSVPTAESNLPHSAPVLSAPDPPLPANTIPLVSPSELFKEHQPQVIRRIPKGSRDSASQKLCEILGDVLSNNSIEAWMRLLMFPSRCLRIPTRSGRRWSLSSSVNKQIADEASLSPTRRPHRSARQSSQPNSPEFLSHKISQKLEEGDFSGAVRLASSEDSLAPVNDTTFSALLAKHLPPSESSILPPPPPDPASIQISFPPAMVAQAIRSFSPGSAGGKDGLSPQHLKDMLNSPSGVTAPLLSALSSFSFHVFSGKTPPLIRPIFFGAKLIAIEKKSGGVRPIAVGNTLRRLVAKMTSGLVREDLSSLFAPRQLGYGVKGGAEAAVHAARGYVQHLEDDKAIIKLDFSNAFNSIHRDKMLMATKDLAPDIYPLVHSCYAFPSSLFWEDKIIQSAEGVQQGDPLGPLLFSLTIHRFTCRLQSELCICYLDDITLGGQVQSILEDAEVVSSMERVGLHLNRNKSEIICDSESSACSQILSSFPEAKVVDPRNASLLGSPIGDVDSVSDALVHKINSLQVMGDRLGCFTAHDSLLLLRHSFSIPRLMYLLRSSPCFLSPYLLAYDKLLCSIVSRITNVQLTVNDVAWSQATLPICHGGLGVRSAVQLASSTFLSSAAACTDLISCILPPFLKHMPVAFHEAALEQWSSGLVNPSPPSGTEASQQKAWVSPYISQCVDTLLRDAPDDTARARLLAVSSPESGAWLHALPLSNMGLRMDDSTIRVAIGIRLGLPLAHPHNCGLCGAEVDKLSTHGLSCKMSRGRHFRHSSLNDIISRAFEAAKIPTRLEPSGLVRSDGKRPDGITMVPWDSGRCIVWDVTCSDTLAPAYRCDAVIASGAVASLAERRKESKYSHLSQMYKFVPIAIETLGVMGPKTRDFIKCLGKRITRQSGDPREHSYLLQRLSVAIQHGNCASVMGSLL